MSETTTFEDPEPGPAYRLDLLDGHKTPGDGKPTPEGIETIKQITRRRLAAVAFASDYFDIEPTDTELEDDRNTHRTWPHRKTTVGQQLAGQVVACIQARVVYTEDLMDDSSLTVGVVLGVSPESSQPSRPGALYERLMFVPLEDARELYVSREDYNKAIQQSGL